MSARAVRMLLVLSFVALGSGRADVIKLKNGKVMEGLVTKETDTTVTLNVGVGEVKLKRSQIAAIEKAGAEGREAMEKEWQRHYFTHKRFVPKGWEDIASDFTGLEQQRQAAINAQKQARKHKADIAKALADVRAYQKEAVAVAAQITAFPPPEELKTVDEVAAYNRLIGRGNTLRNQITVKEALIEETEAAMNDAASVPALYQRGLASFSQRYSERVAASGTDTNHPTFFEAIDARLKAYESEWQAFDVAYDDTNDTSIVTVMLNDKATGRFILDTGATTMTLSRRMADHIGLDTTGDVTISATLADGSSATAIPVILKSVQVGDARVENVRAAVLDREPSPGIDGLLGMSFLREFEVRLDATGHRIELTRMKAAAK
jgi:clan AA aspartic protease (TIGR02281 family)